jgi:hypothetical protein
MFAARYQDTARGSGGNRSRYMRLCLSGTIPVGRVPGRRYVDAVEAGEIEAWACARARLPSRARIVIIENSCSMEHRKYPRPQRCRFA